MARTRTLTELIADVRQRTNMENSEFVTDPEITEYLNQDLAELYGRLTQAEGHPHFRSSSTIAVTPAVTLYALPSDFWRVQQVTALVDGISRSMEPFMENERADLLNTQYFSAMFAGAPRYRVQAGNIEILPANRAFTATLWYTRSCPRLVAGPDVTDGFGGYEVAAIYGTCATVLAKEESDPSFYLGQRERIYRQIDALASQRDASHPERVVDVVGLRDLEWLP